MHGIGASARNTVLADDALLIREQAAEIAQYRKMYDRSSALARIGVWECDLATEALTWTDGIYDLFEIPRGSRIEREQVLELYYDDSRREMERLRSATIRDGGSFSLDIHIRTAKGNERWLRLTGDVERENGRSVRIFGTKQDITEERKAQDTLRALQTELIHVSRKSAMGAMATTLAHELNQPLAAIGNYVAGARAALESPEPNIKMLAGTLGAIEDCVFRAGNIIRGLRAMTSGNASTRRPIDLAPLIREAAALALGAPGDKPEMRYSLDEPIVVIADPVQIQQVFINLIKNASEAMQGSRRREIAVSAAIADGAVKISVDDTGSGIEPGMLDRIFDSFVSSKPQGTGVGLSVSRTIIEAHGGKIIAANPEAGGASFGITLPLAEKSRAALPGKLTSIGAVPT